METTYNAIYQDFSAVKFISLEKALQANPPLIVELTREYVQNFQYRNLHLSFRFFNQEGREIFEITQGNWKVFNVSVGGDSVTGFQMTQVWSDVCDPRGVVKREHWGGGLSGIIKMLQFLSTASKLQDWNLMELSQTNERLKAENEELKGTIRYLKSELEKYKSPPQQEL